MSKSRAKSAGVALLSVLIIVASISATVGWLLYSQYVDIVRATHVTENDRSFLFVLAFEDTVSDLLGQEVGDSNNQRGKDFYAWKNEQGQLWSRTTEFDLSPLLNHAWMAGVSDLSIKIYDLQGLFDVNSLLHATAGCGIQNASDLLKKLPPDMRLHQVWQRAFAHLLNKKIYEPLTYVDEPPDIEATEVLQDSLLDWLDRDDARRDNGAEDAEYSLAKVPYHAANAALTSIDELYFVQGFDTMPRNLLTDLTGLLTALPALPSDAGCPKPINLLTTPVPVLEALIAVLHPALEPHASEKASELKDKLCNPIISNQQNMEAIVEKVLIEDLEEEQQKPIQMWAKTLAGRAFSLRSNFFAAHIAFRYSGRLIETNSIFVLRRSDAPDYRPEGPNVQLVRRYPGPDRFAGFSFHEGGTTSDCREDKDLDF